MKAKVKTIETEVVGKPEKFANASNLQVVAQKFAAVANFSGEGFESELARQIQADHEACERSSRLLAVASLRNGIRLAWVRDHSPKKSALPFIEEYLPGLSQRTAYNYLKIADVFLQDAGLKDKKTFKLTDASKIAPLLSTQLELFDTQEMKAEGAMKKLLKWIGDRGLSQIYRDLSGEAPDHKLTGGARTKTKKTARDLHKEALEALHDLLGLRQGDWWQHLDQGEMATLITNLHDWQKEATAYTKGPKTPAIRKASDADV
jgi:hypothetical protein